LFYQDSGLLQALKDIHAPEADCTGLGVDVTVLAEILTIHIITQGKVTVETERVVVFKDITPEGAEGLVVPNLQDHPISKTAERLRSYRLLETVDITLVLMPEVVAWMNKTIHGYEGTSLFNKFTPAGALGNDPGEFQIKPG
jgi:hypothetical protein